MDINPRENPYTHGALKTDIPLSVRTAFKAHGFKWGGYYRSVKDAMHFEYLGEPVKSEPAAPGLPEVAFGSRLLKLASPMLRGTDVLRLQEELYDCLIDVGRDGIFGTNTRTPWSPSRSVCGPSPARCGTASPVARRWPSSRRPNGPRPSSTARSCSLTRASSRARWSWLCVSGTA